MRELAQEPEKLVLLALRQGFQIIKGEQGFGGCEGVDDEPRAVRLRLLGEVGLLYQTRNLIEHVEIARHHEIRELPFAIGSQLPLFGGEEKDSLKLARWNQLGSTDGERGLAHAAWAVDQRAPSAGLGREGVSDGVQFLVAAEKGVETREVVGDGGFEDGRVNAAAVQ